MVSCGVEIHGCLSRAANISCIFGCSHTYTEHYGGKWSEGTCLIRQYQRVPCGLQRKLPSSTGSLFVA